MATSGLSYANCPRELGQLSTIIPHHHGITIIFFETVVGDFSSEYFMNKTNNCLTIDSYVGSLISKLNLHTDKNHICLFSKCRKKHLHFDFVSYLFYIDLELPRSLANGNHFSSTYVLVIIIIINNNINYYYYY